MAVKNWSVAVGFFCHLCKPAKDNISTQSSPAIIALSTVQRATSYSVFHLAQTTGQALRFWLRSDHREEVFSKVHSRHAGLPGT